MKLTIVASVALATCVGAQADTFTFTGADGNSWNVLTNWEDANGNPGIPDSTDTAIIPANKAVHTDAENVACKIIQLASTGALHVHEGSTFELHGGSSPVNDSTVDGLIAFMKHDDSDVSPVLKIMNSTTIKGSTGVILGGADTVLAKGVVSGDTSSVILTLEEYGAGVGLKLFGELDLEVNLVNNAEVNPLEGNTITLKTNPKSGTGLWFVQYANGRIDVDVELSGTGTLSCAHPDGTVNINADCPDFAGYVFCGGTLTVNNELATSDLIRFGGGEMILNAPISMTGDVEVYGGTLTVNENFCTTGDIRYHIGGTIVVADGGSTPIAAAFGGACP